MYLCIGKPPPQAEGCALGRDSKWLAHLPIQKMIKSQSPILGGGGGGLATNFQLLMPSPKMLKSPSPISGVCVCWGGGGLSSNF